MLEQHEPKIYAPIATNSTIPRDIRDRFADILNVKDYGAVGDGNTNDTQSFKNAKSAANTKNTVVYVPYGTYKITENIADNQSDISANAHTFLTDGHVTITGGGSVNVLDLSKALTRENGGLSVDNINNNGPIYLNSNSKLDFREGNGLVRVTNEDDGKQYITIKPKTNGGIVVDSGGISIDTSKIPVSAPITNTNGTIGFNPGTNSPITVTSGELGLNVGTGLEVTSSGQLICNVSAPEYTAGNGVNITSGTISAKVDGSTIGFIESGINAGALKVLSTSGINSQTIFLGDGNSVLLHDFGNNLVLLTGELPFVLEGNLDTNAYRTSWAYYWPSSAKQYLPIYEIFSYWYAKPTSDIKIWKAVSVQSPLGYDYGFLNINKDYTHPDTTTYSPSYSSGAINKLGTKGFWEEGESFDSGTQYVFGNDTSTDYYGTRQLFITILGFKH